MNSGKIRVRERPKKIKAKRYQTPGRKSYSEFKICLFFFYGRLSLARLTLNLTATVGETLKVQ